MTEPERPTEGPSALGRLLRHLDAQAHSPLVVVLLVLLLGGQVALMTPPGRTVPAMCDADVYAMAADNARHGKPLYPLTPQGDPRTPEGGYLPFLYPPPFAAALAPLGNLPHQTTVNLFRWLALLGSVAYALCLVRLAGRAISLRSVLVALNVLLLMPGFRFNLIAGQIEPLLWTMFALAIMGMGRGGLLAASCLVKPFAAWPLALAAWREPKRVLPWAAGVLIAGFLVGGLVCGWGSYAQWLAYAPARMYRVAFYYENISLGLAPLRLLGWTQLPAWGRPFLMGMYLLMPGLVAWAMRRRPAALQIGWVGAAAILFAPFSRMYYLPLLLVPIAAELGEAKTEERKNGKTEEQGTE